MEALARTGKDPREVEWQFDALDLRPVVRWLETPDARTDAGPVMAVPNGVVGHVDVYVDTDDHRFQRAGYALRIRRLTGRRAKGAEATLKARRLCPLERFFQT